MKKKIVVITKTNDRFYQIKNNLEKLSGNSFEIKNKYFPLEKLANFKRKHFLQIFYCIPDLLIIDQNISGGKIVNGNDKRFVSLLKKMIGLSVIDKNTNILVLLNKESEKQIEELDSFIFTEGAKAEYFVENLYKKVSEIFLR